MVTPDDTRAYITDDTSGAVLVIDTASDNPRYLPSGLAVTAMRRTHSRAWLYVPAQVQEVADPPSWEGHSRSRSLFALGVPGPFRTMSALGDCRLLVRQCPNLTATRTGRQGRLLSPFFVGCTWPCG